MIKVASSAPMKSQPVANGFPAPPPSVPAGDAPTAMVYTNPAVNAELPEVNEPKKPLNGGEAKLLNNKTGSRCYSIMNDINRTRHALLTIYNRIDSE